MGEVAAFNQKMLNTENSGGSVDIFIDRLRGGGEMF